jgi:hypothetical protein
MHDIQICSSGGSTFADPRHHTANCRELNFPFFIWDWGFSKRWALKVAFHSISGIDEICDNKVAHYLGHQFHSKHINAPLNPAHQMGRLQCMKMRFIQIVGPFKFASIAKGPHFEPIKPLVSRYWRARNSSASKTRIVVTYAKALGASSIRMETECSMVITRAAMSWSTHFDMICFDHARIV